MSVLESGCSEEWAIIGIPTIRCISEQLWVITCNKNCCEAFYTNEMSTISNCYESVLWIQSHMLPCNFGETPVFWNPVPGVEGSVSRMCADPGCHDPMIWPAELSEWTCVCRTVWFVELAYCACAQPECKQLCCESENIGLLMWLNRLQLSVCEHSRVCIK